MASVNGTAFAKLLAKTLQENGAAAEFVEDPSSQPPENGLVVKGAVTILDAAAYGGGGFSYGAGGQVVEGERVVGEVRGYHHCDYGPFVGGPEARGETCMEWVSAMMAGTIIDGTFEEDLIAVLEEEQEYHGGDAAIRTSRDAMDRAGRIIVTAGPISQPYRILGPVHVDSIGMVNFGSVLRDALFASPLERAVRGPTPAMDVNHAYAALRLQAAARYDSADAVINATYHVDKNGTAYADGLAVRFSDGPAAVGAARPGEDRLREIKALLDQGLISPAEYDEKRKRILDEI